MLIRTDSRIKALMMETGMGELQAIRHLQQRRTAQKLYSRKRHKRQFSAAWEA